MKALARRGAIIARTLRHHPVFWLGMFVLLATRIWIGADIRVVAIADAYYDDRLFVDLAREILEGGWLGSYDKLTLIKGMFYPYFLAVTHLFGVPLMAAQQGLYIVSCLIFVAAILPYLPNRHWGLLVLAVMLFNPGSLAESVIGRAAREGIYPSLTLLTLAGTLQLGLAAASGRPLRKTWGYLAGLSLAAFWLTREEGIWLLPSAGLPLLYGAIVAIRRGEFDRQSRRMLMLPVLVPVFAVLAVSLINLGAYGVFRTTDMGSRDFLDAYGALTRIEAEHWSARVPVPREVREQAYQVSPAFARLRNLIEGPYLEGFRGTGRANGQADFGGGTFLWGLRDAVVRTVGEKDAVAVDRYLRQIAQEVNAACADGKLHCGPIRSGLSPPWNSAYSRHLPGVYLETLRRILTFHRILHRFYVSGGSDENLALFHSVVLGDIEPTLRERFGVRTQLGGWVVSPLGRVDLRLLDASGQHRDEGMSQWFPGPDLQDLRSELPWLNERGAASTGFSIDAPCPQTCVLEISAGGASLARVPLDGTLFSLARPDYRINFHLAPSQGESRPAGRREVVAEIYQVLVPSFLAMVLIGYLYLTLRVLYEGRVGHDWILLSALLGAVLARAAVISVVHVTAFYAMLPQYLSAAYAPALAFMVLAPILALGRISAATEKEARQP